MIVITRIDEYFAAPEKLLQFFKRRQTLFTLRYDKLRKYLPSVLEYPIPKDTDGKTSFSVHKTNDPSHIIILPFLLIVCAEYIVTGYTHKDKYTLVVSDTPDVPAYSQILIKQISYFKTVIVTADIDGCLAPRAKQF